MSEFSRRQLPHGLRNPPPEINKNAENVTKQECALVFFPLVFSSPAGLSFQTPIIITSEFTSLLLISRFFSSKHFLRILNGSFLSLCFLRFSHFLVASPYGFGAGQEVSVEDSTMCSCKEQKC